MPADRLAERGRGAIRILLERTGKRAEGLGCFRTRPERRLIRRELVDLRRARRVAASTASCSRPPPRTSTSSPGASRRSSPRPCSSPSCSRRSRCSATSRATSRASTTRPRRPPSPPCSGTSGCPRPGSSTRPRTPPSASASACASTPSATSVAQLQQALTDLGFYSGPIDGRYSAATIEAVRAFQRDLGVPETGVIDVATLQAIYARGISSGVASVPTTTAPPATTAPPPDTTRSAADRRPRHRPPEPPDTDAPATTEPPAGRARTTSTRSSRPIRSSRRWSRCSTRPGYAADLAHPGPADVLRPDQRGVRLHRRGDARPPDVRSGGRQRAAAQPGRRGCDPRRRARHRNAAVVRRLPRWRSSSNPTRSPSRVRRSSRRTSVGSNGIAHGVGAVPEPG